MTKAVTSRRIVGLTAASEDSRLDSPPGGYHNCLRAYVVYETAVELEKKRRRRKEEEQAQPSLGVKYVQDQEGDRKR